MSFGIATTVLAGAAGSGTGGLAIAMSNIAPEYIAMGVNPEVLHRIGTMACNRFGFPSSQWCSCCVVDIMRYDP